MKNEVLFLEEIGDKCIYIWHCFLKNMSLPISTSKLGKICKIRNTPFENVYSQIFAILVADT